MWGKFWPSSERASTRLRWGSSGGIVWAGREEAPELSVILLLLLFVGGCLCLLVRTRVVEVGVHQLRAPLGQGLGGSGQRIPHERSHPVARCEQRPCARAALRSVRAH